MNHIYVAAVGLSLLIFSCSKSNDNNNSETNTLLLKEQERTGLTLNDSITQKFAYFDNDSLEINLFSVGEEEFLAERETVVPTTENKRAYKFIQIVNPNDSMAVIFNSPEQFNDYMTSHNYVSVLKEEVPGRKIIRFIFSKRP